jgi:hypothetical protein
MTVQSYAVAQLDGGFSITANGNTETFWETGVRPQNTSLIRGKDGKLEFGGRGFYRLAQLGLFDPDACSQRRGGKEPPTVESVLAGATASPVAAAAPLAPPKAAAPVAAISPELAQAILRAADAGRLMPKAASARAMPAANEPDPPDVVAARINGQRPSVGHEAIMEAHGWNNIIESINAKRDREGRNNVWTTQ